MPRRRPRRCMNRRAPTSTAKDQNGGMKKYQTTSRLKTAASAAGPKPEQLARQNSWIKGREV